MARRHKEPRTITFGAHGRGKSIIGPEVPEPPGETLRAFRLKPGETKWTRDVHADVPIVPNLRPKPKSTALLLLDAPTPPAGGFSGCELCGALADLAQCYTCKSECCDGCLDPTKEAPRQCKSCDEEEYRDASGEG